MGLLLTLGNALSSDYQFKASTKKNCPEEEVCFADTLSVGDSKIDYKNSSLYRFWGFKVYKVALYYEGKEININWNVLNTENNSVKLSSQDFAITLFYYRDIKSADFLKSAKKILARNPNWDDYNIDDKLAKFSSYITDVSFGDRYTLIYKSSSDSLILIKNEKDFLFEMSGSLFAANYLGIWLGPYAVKEDQREELLGGING